MTFLRPWFLLLLLVPFLFSIFNREKRRTSSWEEIISPELLPFLLVKGTTAKTKRRQLYRIILWSFLCIALSGPSWKQKNIPTIIKQPATVLILDLSYTMTGDNLKRAQQKIYDILKYLEGEQIGLVLYDEYGYTAIPLTFETDLLREIIPQLSAEVLPTPAISKPNTGFKQAYTLLNNTNIGQGRILFLTAGGPSIEQDIIPVKKEHKIGILGIGPLGPHPIPLETGGFLSNKNGEPLMVQFQPEELNQIGYFQVMTPDDSDIQNLLARTEPTISEREIESSLSIPEDMGCWIILFCLPFFALMFRKNILFLICLTWILPAQAGLWLRPDQESYYRQKQGISSYRREQYEAAEKLFKSGFNVDDLYNAGNALAFQMKIDEAIAVYEQVLEQQPDHKDALFNKEYLEKQNTPPPPEEETPPPPEEETPPQPEEETPPPSEEEKLLEQMPALPKNLLHYRLLQQYRKNMGN